MKTINTGKDLLDELMSIQDLGINLEDVCIMKNGCGYFDETTGRMITRVWKTTILQINDN